ncbi:MAG TPA: polysaccharide biosynthesis tyrosine autokinase [Pseudogracilibacillus sp.]|nr:polysaccharide biosynthesis tyrosine autokinase [Pseudogracilibacillus sp.]
MNNTFNVQDFLNIAVKRIKLVLIIPIACAIVGFLISSYLINPVYESQVDLLVNQTQTEDEKVTGTTDVEMNLRLIETYQFIIKSSKIRELVYEQFNHQYTLEELKDNLSVETSPDSQIITLHARASNPEDASKLVNTFAHTSQEEITDLMKMDNVRILTEAKTANFQKPVWPNPFLNTGISFLVGLFFVFNYIALSDFLNTKIHSRQDVERYLEAPLLGTIGMFNSNKQKEISLSNISYLVSKVNQNKLNLESFRNLRVNIQFQKSTKKLTSIVVTSTEKNEGKTITSGNLAMSMAMDSKKTLLIDADLRKSSWEEYVKHDGEKGLSNYLSGQAEMEELIQETSYENLYIIRGGPLPPNPTELISSLRMDKLLTSLEKQFDMIIIDSPPMYFSDAAVLSTKVDGCVFVSHAGKTKVSHAQQAMNQLLNVNANILGVVLNNKKEKKKAVSY